MAHYRTVVAHFQLDSVGVPRFRSNGSRLKLVDRVAWLCGQYEALQGIVDKLEQERSTRPAPASSCSCGKSRTRRVNGVAVRRWQRDPFA